MTTIRQLRRPLSDLPRNEALQLILAVRESRRTNKRVVRAANMEAKKKTTKAVRSVLAGAKGMTDEQLELYIQSLEAADASARVDNSTVV